VVLPFLPIVGEPNIYSKVAVQNRRNNSTESNALVGRTEDYIERDFPCFGFGPERREKGVL
jgi:hypothetical protein